ncbi:hypothetical protein O77CONTIG1_04816 [Leptolyngbya sp. O-77]|nr:hypothetical protein O77CONTIG1_04816 [Leptolyngbya sp. O-77]
MTDLRLWRLAHCSPQSLKLIMKTTYHQLQNAPLSGDRTNLLVCGLNLNFQE